MSERKMKLFVPISKVEKTADDTRMVYGILALEEVDKDNEVMDYAESKKYFEAWNADYREKTKAMGVEESVGNLRAMHKSISAGAFRDMAYDDDAKTITVAAEVVDADEVKKVDKGVYTGFSIGARRVKANVDKKLAALRWVADPYEGSIVDNPCMYSAAITAVKAAGTDENAEIVKFVGKHAEKSLYSVSRLSSIIQDLAWLASDTQYEAEYEGDNSPLPAELRGQCKSLCDTLKKLVAEEADETVAALAQQAGESQGAKSMTKVIAEAGERPKTPATKADEPGVRPVETPAAAPATEENPASAEVSKAKTPNKAQLLEALANIKTQIESLEEPVVSAETPAAEAAKVAAPAVEKVDVEKLKADIKSELETEYAQKFDAVNKQLQTILETPMPSPVKNNEHAAVTKDDEGGKTAVEEPKSATDAIKLIHAAGPKR